MRLLILILLITLASTVSAQQVYTPEKGSAERTAILAALRVPIEKTLKQNIVFVTDGFSVNGTWAFVSGQPTTPSGGKPSLDGDEDMFDDKFLRSAPQNGREMEGCNTCLWVHRRLLP